MEANELITEQEWSVISRRLGLGGRMGEIARRLMDAKADKQIATELGVSVSTVRTYLARLFRRVGVDGRVELIVCVFRELRAVIESEN